MDEGGDVKGRRDSSVSRMTESTLGAAKNIYQFCSRRRGGHGSLASVDFTREKLGGVSMPEWRMASEGEWRTERHRVVHTLRHARKRKDVNQRNSAEELGVVNLHVPACLDGRRISATLTTASYLRCAWWWKAMISTRVTGRAVRRYTSIMHN